MRPARLLAALTIATAACGAPPSAPPPRALEEPAPPLPPPREDGRLPELARPIATSLSLDVDPSRDTYSGEVVVDLALRAPTRHLVMRAEGLVIDAAVLQAAGRTARARAASRAGASGEELVLETERTLPPGDARLALTFRGRVGLGPHDALARVPISPGQPLAHTPERRGGRELFPSFDDAAMTAPISLTVTVPRGLAVVSTAPEATSSPRAAVSVVRFHPTSAIAPSSLALAVGPLAVTSPPGARVRVLAPRTGLGATETAAVTEALVGHVSAELAAPLPVGGLTVISLPRGALPPEGAALGLGIVATGEPLDRDAPATLALASGIAAQWLGLSRRAPLPADAWLDRGAAAWIGARAAARVGDGPETRVAAWRATAAAMEDDALGRALPLGAPAGHAAAPEVDDGKARAILSTLSSWVGDDAVLAAIRARAAGRGALDAASFLAGLDEATGKEASRLARTFVDAPGAPEVSVFVTCDPKKRWHAEVNDEPFALAAGGEPDASDGRTWLVPVCVTTGASERECVELREGAPTLIAGRGCPSEVHPNTVDAYYRFHVPADRAVSLARHAARFEPRERAAAVFNAFGAFRSGKLLPDQLLDVLAAWDDELDPDVTREILSALDRLGDVVPAELRAPLRAFAEGRVATRRAVVGLSPKPDETAARARLRGALLEASAQTSDDPEVEREARRIADVFPSTPPSLGARTLEALLAIAARGEGPPFAEGLERRARDAAERALVARALVRGGPPPLVERGLEALLAVDVTPRDLYDGLAIASSRRDARGELDGFLRARWPAVEARLGARAVLLAADLVRRSCDEAEVKARVAWYTTRARVADAHRHRLALAADEASACGARRDRLARPLSRAFEAREKKAKRQTPRQ